jgi:hypothetical protein
LPRSGAESVWRARSPIWIATQIDAASLAQAGGEVVALGALPLPLARAGTRRTAVRDGVVLRLRVQHAPQRVPRAPADAAQRVARRTGQRLSAAVQSGRPSQGEGGTGEHLSGSRRRAVGRAVSDHPAGAAPARCHRRRARPQLPPRNRVGGGPGRQYRHRGHLYGARTRSRWHAVFALYLAAARRRPRAWAAGGVATLPGRRAAPSRVRNPTARVDRARRAIRRPPG